MYIYTAVFGMVTIGAKSFIFDAINALLRLSLKSNQNISVGRRVISEIQSLQVFVFKVKFMPCFYELTCC